MNGPILVPLDGSALAARAIPWADAWAQALDAPVELLRVVPAPLLLPAADEDVTLDAWDAVRVQEQLTSAIRQFALAPQVETHLTEGVPSEAIVDHARAVSAVLIVMATHGRTGFTRALMGSVAASVIRQAGLPVLTIRADVLHAPAAPHRILVPVDGSSLSEAVLASITPLARSTASTVHLVWVDTEGRTQPNGAGRVELVSERLEAAGIQTDVEIRSGPDVAAEIVDAVLSSGAGVIAMSTRGVPVQGRWTLGSVADWVIRHAPVPVLAFRPRPSDLIQWKPYSLRDDVAAEGPPLVVTLTPAQARLARVALETLAWSASRHEGITDEIRGALQAVDAALEGAQESGSLVASAS